uniref:Uncharacterized protein n=1 Tax=Arundo donax TaxID=35708 RepID=A0A0A9HQG0_ARUDO
MHFLILKYGQKNCSSTAFLCWIFFLVWNIYDSSTTSVILICTS